MSVRKDITNQKFGKLRALKPIDTSPDGTLRWLCECECGRTIVADGGRLRAGTKKHCGCSTPDFTRKPRKKSNKLSLFSDPGGMPELGFDEQVEDLEDVLKCL